MAGNQPDPRPDPIAGLVSTFELGADSGALQEAAGAVRALGLRAIAAGQTVTTAGDTIESEEAWLGETAANYQHHRRRITDDIASLGYEASRLDGSASDGVVSIPLAAEVVCSCNQRTRS